MILVFLFLFFLIIITLITLILLMSNFKIKIVKLHISNTSGKFYIGFISKISIYIFNKFKKFEITIDDKKIKNIFKNQKISFKNMQFNDTLNIIKKSKTNIETFNIEGYLGVEDAAYTAYIISFINTIIPIFLSDKIYKYNYKKYKYNITPVYINQNIVNLGINCIISIKIVHIINILFKLLKKGRVKKYERSSNRRPYAYSHE